MEAILHVLKIALLDQKRVALFCKISIFDIEPAFEIYIHTPES